MAFIDSLDIANRACQWLGVSRIVSTDEDSVANNEISFAYDKRRRAALQRDVWRFSIRYAALRAIDSTTYLLAPEVWTATTTYPVGALVRDTNSELWVSMTPENYNNDPASTAAWDRYFGPMTVSLYDSTITYYAGELVYKTAGNPGSYVIYVSRENDNDDVPSTAEAWDATLTYQRGDTVSYTGSQWTSLIELNLNVTPATAPLDWLTTSTYSAAQTAVGSDGYIYSSVAGSNINHNPVTDTTHTYWTNTTVPKAWEKVPATYASANSWQPLYAGMSRIQFLSPIGLSSRNVYRLPGGFLRQAVQNPKEGAISSLGGPSGLRHDDWLYEGDYLVTTDTSPMVLRFAADVVDVTKMNDLFCEGLACDLAVAVEPKVGQSSGKLTDIVSAHKKYMGEARLVNAIEKGVVELPEDDLIACRE